MTAAAEESWASPRRAPFVDASPAEVRVALTPEDAVEFDRQWREVMARATEALDLTEVLQNLDSWRRIAWLTTAHGPDGYRALLARADEVLAVGQVRAGNVPWETVKAELGLYGGQTAGLERWPVWSRWTPSVGLHLAPVHEPETLRTPSMGDMQPLARDRRRASPAALRACPRRPSQ